MSAAELLARAAREEATDEDLLAFLDLVSQQAEDARTALRDHPADRRSLLWHHVLGAATPIQLRVCEGFGALGALEHLTGRTFGIVAQRPDALRALVRGATRGGHDDALRGLVVAWVEAELTPENLDEAANEGGRFSENAGVERAARAFVATLGLLPPATRKAALDAMDRVTAGNTSWGARAFLVEVGALCER